MSSNRPPRSQMRPEWPLCIKKFDPRINPLKYHGLYLMIHLARQRFRGHRHYFITVNDLTRGGDLPIFPASSGPDSALERPAKLTKTSGQA